MDKTVLGLKQNWKQFALLVLVNAFVGGMVGLERTIFPEFAATFGVTSKTAILSFIIAFGLTKAVSNYFTGKLANKLGRKNLLLYGWFIALPIPFILLFAPNWGWVIFANVLLGISQGLTWSSTVVMKIDLVGEKDRGFAMGLNEFAGYFAVGIVAFFTGYLANTYGITPYPFYLGIAIAVAGTLLTLFFVKDTRHHVLKETAANTTPALKNVFVETTFTNKTLSSITQAGLVNNLNDGMIWGLFPVLLLSFNFNIAQIGVLTAIYPAIWGIAQIFTGKMADAYAKKRLLFWGMLAQGIAILFIPTSAEFYVLAALAVVLGLGTALVYPTFLAAIAQATPAMQRAESIGTFRLWRDLGYAIGALISGLTADFFGVPAAIVFIGLLTILSSLVLQFRMPKENPSPCLEPKKVKRMLARHQPVVLIDVRHVDEYNAQHIPQAVHIPLTDLADAPTRFSKKQPL
jgi:MFS family permease